MKDNVIKGQFSFFFSQPQVSPLRPIVTITWEVPCPVLLILYKIPSDVFDINHYNNSSIIN